MKFFGPPSQKKLDKRMMRAIENRNLSKLKEAVEAGANPQKAKGFYATPVYQCVRYGFKEGLVYLVSKGASPDGDGTEYNIPFMRAADYGNQPMMELLLEQGANIDIKNYDGRTALHLVANDGKAGLVRYLLEKGADATIADNQMNTAADVAEKEYPRLADLIRGKDTDAEPVAPEAGWHLTAPEEVAHVSEKPAIGYRVTEVFNFRAQLYTRVSRNLENGAESQSVAPFSVVSEGTLVEEAKKMLTALGGRDAADTRTLAGKPRLQTPRQEGFGTP
ncbi:MAG: hypothetical protein GC185_00465 [Alphaproteobacteria bacterium]|nr:hypothetical protein [Alphaproteobacteria bacterium]